MYPGILKLLSRQRGSAITEKLLVLVLTVMLVVPALLLFGPMVQQKFAVVVEALGGPAANSIAAREARTGPSDTALWVVLFSALSLGFSIVFVGPMFFRRMHVRRQVIINELAERFPFLEPLADRSIAFEKNMRELKMLADEVRDIEPARASALQVAAPDLGRAASPADVTMSNEMMPLVADTSNEHTIPGSMVTPQVLRNTPMAGLPVAARPTGPVMDAWAPRPVRPAPAPVPMRSAAPLDLPSFAPIAHDEDHIATIDVSDPSLMTSVPMSEFRDRLRGIDPDQTIMPGQDLERTLPKKGRGQQISEDITMDWSSKPIDE